MRLTVCGAFVLGLITPFFFIAGPTGDSIRSFKDLWNLGHVGYFCIAGLLLYNFLHKRKRVESRGSVSTLSFLYILFVGTGIEFLQFGVHGRSPSIEDILRDLLGWGVATIIWLYLVKRKPFGRKGVMLCLLVAAGLFLAVKPLVVSLYDEHAIETQFPVLADFESTSEITRWRSPSQIKLQSNVVRHGQYAARVQLSTRKYSGVSLVYFYENWQSFSTLHFSVYNPEHEPLKLHCRIHDALHRKNGAVYKDRYNTVFTVPFGWNDLAIDLQQVAAAPENRTMEMGHIRGLSLFVVKQPRARSIYLDHIYLER
ncbi:VanZ family protein [Desulfogranum japonicum]|uniref:VanZ family protein n=1 Tax=Desulfogranum japonicum TaxID=231447 RepID=UPI000491E80B|nr:VanZ family protein [Desulfogranum japonicum]